MSRNSLYERNKIKLFYCGVSYSVCGRGICNYKFSTPPRAYDDVFWEWGCG